MSYIDKYLRYSGVKGNTIKERREHNTKLKIFSDFRNSINYEEIYLNDEIKTVPVQIVEKGDEPTEKTIIMYPELNLKAGDMIKRTNDENWLCLDIDPSPIYISGTIQRCNMFLKWIDKEGKINSLPAFLEADDISNTAIDVDTMMRVPSARRVIRVTNNLDTRKIKRDDRFLFDNQAFIITDIDRLGQLGIISFALKSDLIDNAKDNEELEIADYYSKIKSEVYKIESDDYLSMNINSTYNLNIKLMNENKEVLNPDFVYDFDSEIVNIVNNKVTPLKIGNGIIKVSFKSISKNIGFNIENTSTHNYYVEIKGEAILKMGKAQTYSCNFFDDGNIFQTNSEFYITDLNRQPINIVKIESQNFVDNTCIIKSLSDSSFLNKSFLLNVKSQSGLFLGSKEIKIKSLF